MLRRRGVLVWPRKTVALFGLTEAFDLSLCLNAFIQLGAPLLSYSFVKLQALQ